jgi:hypothetical protein
MLFFTEKLLTIVPDMTKDFQMAHFTQGELTPVTVGEQILHGVKALSKKAISLPKISSFPTSSSTTLLNTGSECPPDKCCGSVPALIFCCDVFLCGRAFEIQN